MHFACFKVHGTNCQVALLSLSSSLESIFLPLFPLPSSNYFILPKQLWPRLFLEVSGAKSWRRSSPVRWCVWQWQAKSPWPICASVSWSLKWALGHLPGFLISLFLWESIEIVNGVVWKWGQTIEISDSSLIIKANRDPHTVRLNHLPFLRYFQNTQKSHSCRGSFLEWIQVWGKAHLLTWGSF